MAAEGSTSSQVANATNEARTQASAVANTAKDEARDVMQEAREQARTATRQLQDDLRERANTEATKFAQTLREASARMTAMADCAGDDQSLPANAVREGAQVAQRVASRLDQGGVDSIMADVRSWARRNPGTFLLGGAVAGFVVGRIARNFSSNGTTSNGHYYESPYQYEGITDGVSGTAYERTAYESTSGYEGTE